MSGRAFRLPERPEEAKSNTGSTSVISANLCKKRRYGTVELCYSMILYVLFLMLCYMLIETIGISEHRMYPVCSVGLRVKRKRFVTGAEDVSVWSHGNR